MLSSLCCLPFNFLFQRPSQLALRDPSKNPMSPVPVTARQRPCASGPVAFLAPASSSAFGSIFGLPHFGANANACAHIRLARQRHPSILHNLPTLCYASRARDMALESLPVPEPAPEFRLDFWASREQREMSGALPRVSSAHRAHRALPFLTRFSSFPRPGVPPLAPQFLFDFCASRKQ
ncbi:hypothetical protein B0H15DRAFT_944426 [Mycena belliarum]|uniref:Uncharacterized protein n=1 Tax=Mycena belliarum TaxID=1033014 RepID=A0AAD6XZZ0_9AGAR|nr:hypothetical protein B0H15DRAFT_944426 [Mycena belliae]